MQSQLESRRRSSTTPPARQDECKRDTYLLEEAQLNKPSSETMIKRADTSQLWTRQDRPQTGVKSQNLCARSPSTRQKEHVNYAHLKLYAYLQPIDNGEQVLFELQLQSIKSPALRSGRSDLATLPLLKAHSAFLN